MIVFRYTGMMFHYYFIVLICRILLLYCTIMVCQLFTKETYDLSMAKSFYRAV